MLGAALILGALVGVAVRALMGGVFAGFMAAGGLWFAASIAVRRDWRAKQGVAVSV